MKTPTIAELTVEDPAEAFEDLRDKNDLQMLLSNEQFLEEGFGPSALADMRTRKSGRGESAAPESEVQPSPSLGPPVNKPWMEKWRRDLKIASVSTTLCRPGLSTDRKQRQFHRLIEMLILSRLDPANGKSLRSYRLQVKERLYRFNFVST